MISFNQLATDCVPTDMAFSSFLAKFLAYLKDHQIWQKFLKNEEQFLNIIFFYYYIAVRGYPITARSTQQSEIQKKNLGFFK